MRRSDVLKAVNQDKKRRVEDVFTPEEIEKAKEAMRIYKHEWYMAHKDAILARARENKDAIRAYKREWYMAHRDAVNAYNRKRAKENKEAIRAYKRDYYNKNKKTLLDYQRKWRADNGAERKAFTQALDKLMLGRPPISAKVRKGRFLAPKKTYVEVVYELLPRLIKAEIKHPRFAENVDEGIRAVVEELGEVAQAISHGEPAERIESEMYDLLTTAFRLVRGDYNHEDEKRDG